MRIRYFLLLAVFCFSLSGTAQEHFYVTEDGWDFTYNPDWNTPISLSAALANANSGDTIHIAQGDYHNPNLGSWMINKDLTLIGGYDISSGAIGDASTTVLYGRNGAEANSSANRVLIIVGRRTAHINVTLENLTLTGGNGTDDNPDILADAIRADADYGGGLFNYFSTTELKDVIVSDNVAATGSDNNRSGYGGGIYNFEAVLTISGNSIIKNNIAKSKGTASGYGGGIYNRSGSVFINGNTRIENNTASHLCKSSGYGGGICNVGSETELVINGGTIDGNTALNNPDTTSSALNGYGGGLLNNQTAHAYIYQGAVIKNNVASNSLGSGYGGGISNGNYASLYFYGGLIEYNVAMSNTASPYISFGGGIYIEESINFEWHGSTAFLKENIASYSKLSEGEDIYPDNTYIVDFSASFGGFTADKEGGLYAVKKDGTFDFTLTSNGRYRRVAPIVKVNNDYVLPPLSFTDDSIVTFLYSLKLTALSSIRPELPDVHIVTFDEAPVDVSYPTHLAGENYITPGNTFDFMLKMNSNVYYVTPTVTVDDRVILPSDKKDEKTYMYSLTETDNKNVQVTLLYRDVTFPDLPEGVFLVTYQPGLCHVPSDSVFSFTLLTDEFHRVVPPTVTANGRTLSPSAEDGEYAYRYVLEETDDSVQITMTGLTVTFPEMPAGIANMTHREGTYYYPPRSTLNFTLKTEEKYKNIAPVVTADDYLLIPFSNGKDDTTYIYTTQVMNDVIIKITGYQTVTLPVPPEGLSFAPPHQTGENYLLYDNDFTFTLVSSEYYYDAVLTVIADGDTKSYTSDDSGKFTITLPRVTEDISVTIIPNYTVTIRPSDLAETNPLPGNYTVVGDEEFLFTFKLYEKYRGDIPIVLANGSPLDVILTGVEDWQYAVHPIIKRNTELQIKLYSESSTFPENTAKAANIYSRNGFLVIEALAGEVPVTVSTLAGRIKAKRTVTGAESIALPEGIYIVKAGEEVRKIIINRKVR